MPLFPVTSTERTKSRTNQGYVSKLAPAEKRGRKFRESALVQVSHNSTVADLVIIASFSWMDEAAARTHEPKVVFVDEQNRIREKRAEVPGPARAA